MINKFKVIVAEINNSFNNKDMIYVILLSIIGVSIPTVSGNPNLNFWIKFYEVITNETFNFFLFSTLIINIFLTSRKTFINHNIIIRMSDYRSVVKESIKKNIINSLYIYIINIIIAISGSLLVAFDGFNIVNHNYYNIILPAYLTFYIIRSTIILIIIISIIFLIYTLVYKKRIKVIILLINIIFFIPLTIIQKMSINNFSCIYSIYFNNVKYETFSQEVIYSCLYISLLIMTKRLIENYISKNKRDILC